MAIEREVKLGASAGFRLPALGDYGSEVSVVDRPPQTLMAVYHDTPDLRLARWGVTLRHRSGDGSKWTVKLPEGNDGPALVRRELDFDGPANRMPDTAAALVLGYARGVPLMPVARLRTIRSGVDLIDGEGSKVAEVVDDEVSVIDHGRVVARFREVEVELGEAAPAGLLDTLVATLREAGAGAPDSTPKVIRALGPRAIAPPDVEVRALSRDATVADMITHAIASSVTRIFGHDPGVRLGDDPDDVRQVSVGAHQLRSDLHRFRPMLDEAWLTPLRVELRWLAELLSAVHDADGLEDRFRRQAVALREPSKHGLSQLFRQLAMERDATRTILVGAMMTPRYIALLDELVAAARAPRFVPGAHRPARRVAPKLVVDPWKKLRAEVRRLPSDPSPESLHQVGNRARRARYAAEAAVPVVGRKARRLARALTDFQTVLTDHQEAVVAERWLRRSTSSPEAAVQETAEKLITIQRAEAEDCRRRWRPAWEKASAKRLRSWL